MKAEKAFFTVSEKIVGGGKKGESEGHFVVSE